MRPPPWALPIVSIAMVTTLVVGASARALAADAGEAAPTNEHYVLRAELGPEIDTNAHRTEHVNDPAATNPAPVVSALARGVIAASLQDVVVDGHQVFLSATLAGKLFEKEAARSEDVAIAETGAQWRATLGTRSVFALSAAYYEAFQRAAASPDYATERRDFRSLTTGLRLSRWLADHVDAGLGAGFRLFAFKPNHSYDFHAPSASLDVRWARETADGGADWEIASRLGYERRAFAGKALTGTITGCPMPEACALATSPDGRVDQLFSGALDVSRTGGVLVAGGYALHLNRSNSFGETVTRQFITARFAAELPLALTLAVRLEVLFARYVDSTIGASDGGRAYVTYDDENRSNARVDLSRDLGDRLQLVARYTLYTNELAATNVTYRRQTALLSLSYTFEK